MSLLQTSLVVVIMIGIFLISTRTFTALKNIVVERGAYLAIGATIGMGIINFLFGIGAREIGPLAINWFTSIFLAIACLIFILKRRQYHFMLQDWRSNKKLISFTGLFDNLAWVAYTYTVLYLPIAIATSLTESYIALATLLGLIYNKEKLRAHQFVGLLLCVVAAITLAGISE